MVVLLGLSDRKNHLHMRVKTSLTTGLKVGPRLKANALHARSPVGFFEQR